MTRFVRLQTIALLAIVTMVVASSLTRAGWIEEKDGKTVINLKLWSLPDPTRVDTKSKADYETMKLFLERFPEIFKERYAAKYKADPATYGDFDWDNVKIELHRFSGISVEGQSMDSGPLMAIAGGVSPDIIYVNFRQSDTYIQQGFLYPLDLPEDNYIAGMTEEEKDFQIHPKTWPVIRRRGPDGEEHVWAKPSGGVLGKVMVYRKDLLEAAGVPYPQNDWTWEDLYRACRKLTDPAKGTYGIRFGKGKSESWFWVTFLWSAGGEAMEYDEEEDQWYATFNSRAGAEAIDYYTRLCAEIWFDDEGNRRYGYAAMEVDETRKWDLGQIGFMATYIDEKLFATLNPDLVGMVPVPFGPGGNRGGELNSRMNGIYSGVESQVIRDAAWEYLRFIDSKEAMEVQTRLMVEGGLGRFVNPRYLKMFGYEDIIRLAPKGWEEIFQIAIETGKPEPYGRNSQRVYEYMTDPLKAVRDLELSNSMPRADEDAIRAVHAMLQPVIEKRSEDDNLIRANELLERAIDRRNNASLVQAQFLLEQAMGINERLFVLRDKLNVYLADTAKSPYTVSSLLGEAMVLVKHVTGVNERANSGLKAPALEVHGLLEQAAADEDLEKVRSAAAILNQQIESAAESDLLAVRDKLEALNRKVTEERIAIIDVEANAAARNANEKMIGVLTARQLMVRRSAAAVLLVLIAIAFALVFRKIFKAFTPPEVQHTEKKQKWGFKKYGLAYIIILPAVLSIFVWQYVPLMIGSLMAFQDYQIVGDSVWVGIDNFGNILWDHAWWMAVWNSVRYSILVISLTFLPPVILAVLLDEIPHGKILFRTIFYLPAVITGLVVIYLWRSFYEPNEFGVLNTIVMSIPALGYILIGLLFFTIMFFFAKRLYIHQSYWPALLCLGAGITLFTFAYGFVRQIFSLHDQAASWYSGLIWFPVWAVIAAIFAFLAYLLWKVIRTAMGSALNNSYMSLLVGSIFSLVMLGIFVYLQVFLREMGGMSTLYLVQPEAYRWLDDDRTAMICCVIPMVWAGMGPGCLIYLAALKGIAPDFYEAADIDGATFIDKILFIVIPILKPLLIINFVGVFIGAWNSSAYILAMTGGGSNTEVAGLHIFYKAYLHLKFGPAAAMAWILGFMLIGFTVYQLRILSRLEFKTTGNKE